MKTESPVKKAKKYGQLNYQEEEKEETIIPRRNLKIVKFLVIKNRFFDRKELKKYKW